MNPHIDFDGINRTALAQMRSFLGQLLPGGKIEGHEYVVCNPTRNDRNPGSFKINMRTGTWADFATGDTGNDLISLAAYVRGMRNGKAAVDVAAMVGFHIDARKPNGKDHAAAEPKKVVVKRFDHFRRDGTLEVQVERVEFKKPDGTFVLTAEGKHEKTIRQRRPYRSEPNIWIWGITAGEYMRRAPGKDWCRFKESEFAKFPSTRERETFNAVEPCLYRQADVLEAIEKRQTVFVVEGQGKVDVLWAWNIPATCNPDGAKKWRAEHAQFLHGADIVILPDNDEPGRQHADMVGRSLVGIAENTRVLELPGLKLKGDIKDWADAGHTPEELWKLVETYAKPYAPTLSPPEEFLAGLISDSTLSAVANAIGLKEEHLEFEFRDVFWLAMQGQKEIEEALAVNTPDDLDFVKTQKCLRQLLGLKVRITPDRATVLIQQIISGEPPPKSGKTSPKASKSPAITSSSEGVICDEVLSEHSAAVTFKNEYKDHLRFDHHRGSWFEWTGSYWQPETTMRAFDLVRNIVTRLAGIEDEKMRRSSERYAFIYGVEKMALTDRAFAVTSDVWDCDPFLLGTPGGTVDLRTGELRPADPVDHISKITAVAPAITSDCPRWRQFLKEATGGDEGVIRFLWQWAGYCLTGETREHALLFGYGPGGNGKGVWLNTIVGIMKDYATTAAMSTFTAASVNQHSTELAMLQGARQVSASETEEGHAWAESRIKSLTGGDPITARFMRQDNFTFVPNFKLTIIGNHQPTLSNVDEAVRRRFNIVPFTYKPATPDRHLFDKLRKEWPGILRWMIEGCLDWQKNGLISAATIKAATTEYFSDQDLLAQWLDEQTDAEPGNTFKTATSSDLFKSWATYARAAGEDPGTQKRFAAALKDRGFKPARINTARLWQGLRLKVKEDYDGNFGR
jgi:putative DNA primase/helicase